MPQFDPLSMVFSTVFGIVGVYYFRHGKQEASAVSMLSGVGLMAYSLFVRGPWLNLLVGLALSLLPWGMGMLGVDF